MSAKSAPSNLQKNMPIRIRVTNKDSKYRLKHGSDFGHLLEARDQVMEHEFDFIIEADPSELREREFSSTDCYAQLCDNVLDFLVEAVSNIVSAAFQFVLDKKLEGKEAKAYASKNILLNIHAVFRKVVQAIQSSKPLLDLIGVAGEEALNGLRKELLIEVELMMEDIMANLQDNYPQATATGGTLKMRETLNNINRTENEEYDLIYANNISIKEYFTTDSLKKEDGDYTAFIMKVVN